MSAPKSKNERQTMSSLIEESAERRPGLVDRAEAEFEAGRLKSQLAAERSLLAAFQAKAAECEQAPEGVLDDETALEAFVKAKAEAVASMVEGPITANCPASALQMHPKCTLLIDEAAASGLQRVEYYRWVYEHKPDWQRI